MSLPRIICVTGHTASGKSSLGMELARALGAVIVSVDSMQVYRGFDIGTAKATAAEQAEIPHYGIDLCAPSERYSAGRFMEYARDVIAEQQAAGRPVLAVGGTGLYLKAMLHGLGPDAPADRPLRARLQADEASDPGVLHRRLTEVDPTTAARLHPNDLVRCERALEVFMLSGEPISQWHARHNPEPSFDSLSIGLSRTRTELRARIEARLAGMLRSGWIEEVAGLLAAGVTEEMTPMIALGYRDIAAHLRGECGADELFTRINVASRRFAKRQTTWFNREPSVHWLTPAGDLPDRLLPVLSRFLAGESITSLEAL